MSRLADISTRKHKLVDTSSTNISTKDSMLALKNPRKLPLDGAVSGRKPLVVRSSTSSKRKTEKKEEVPAKKEEMFNSPWKLTPNANWQPLEAWSRLIDEDLIPVKEEDRSNIFRARRKANFSRKKIKPLARCQTPGSKIEPVKKLGC